MSDAIIKVEGLGKRYRLGGSGSSERYTALRDVIAEKARSVFRNPNPRGTMAVKLLSQISGRCAKSASK
jgi:hypothetical protein